MNQVPKLRLVDWQEFHRMSYELGSRIKAEVDGGVDVIVSIDRGGAVVSRIVSDVLSLQILSIGILSYVGINNQKSLKFNQELDVDIAGKTVLLVDEICDTGKTFEAAVEHLQSLGPKKVITTSLFLKDHSTFTPDFVAEVDNSWVVFPYEVEETKRGLAEYMEDEGLRRKLEGYFGRLEGGEGREKCGKS